MGAKTFNLLRSLIQPDKPGDKTYDVIVQTLARHFSPQPLIITERFHLHLADAFIQSDLHMCDLQCIHILHLH